MMVQTRAVTKRIESGQELPQDTTVVPHSPKKRRQDGVAPPKKRHRGKPGELCQLNLDVLFLLAAYVHPLDLLNLARTCKSLRELLMDKSSTFVWKTARGQAMGLPDCPADLTEPEYANLVFYARCHSCGKYAKKVHWRLRRRYCPECRHQRLYRLASCPDVIRYNYVIPSEYFIINGEKTRWVDKEQMDSSMNEYNSSSDKEQFLSQKRSQFYTIDEHATRCKYWEDRRASERRSDLELRRRDRYDSIFERLKHHGYQPEIAHFGHYAIQSAHKSFFRTSKLLTDKEWAQMLPDWLPTMENFKSQRLEKVVYRQRRDLLASEYNSFLASRSPESPVFELLPHAVDIASFPPFHEVIRAPEGADMGAKPFESAFEQLPLFVDEWKKKLDAEFTELIEIPSHLSSQAGSSTAPMEPSQASTDKLRLACAVFTKFNSGYTVARYPEVLASWAPPSYSEPDRTGSIVNRYGVRFVKEAPHIIHACGLDPSTATVEEVDCRNVRLKCLSCSRRYVMTWRRALRHSLYYGHSSNSGSARWEIIGDEHMDTIQAAELPKEEVLPGRMRCLLCYPCVGDDMGRDDTMYHLTQRHGIERDAIKEGVHYKFSGLYEPSKLLEMVEEGGQVTFKESTYLF